MCIHYKIKIEIHANGMDFVHVPIFVKKRKTLSKRRVVIMTPCRFWWVRTVHSHKPMLSISPETRAESFHLE